MFSVSESVFLLEEIIDHMVHYDHVCEAQMTPYQKAQQARRQTIAAHTPRPAKQSPFYQHMVRAIFQKLRKNGEAFKGAAKGGQLIAQWALKKHGYAQGKTDHFGMDTGDFSLTSKGRSRNLKHSKEPASIRDKKRKAYDYIMGIQRRQQQRQQQVIRKAAGAG